ncbi:MAG: Alpha-D-glucose 1-phosphate phosphatase YihX [Elusimicrobia bacterium]|nr:Alpha-D-glucose 1-phosphate phosphatase YihX [Elusimicrobiota bacterium]
MIKTVLFDLGNVILPFDVMRLAKRLTKHSHLSAPEIVERLWNDYIADHFETGKMSPQEYFVHITELCQFKDLTYEEFEPIFNEIFDEDAEIVALISRLKGRYKLGIISNTNEIHVRHIKKTYSYLSHFDFHWWSNEAGVRKPNPAIYQMALTHFSVNPSEAVFIDDLHTNIATAKQLGINAIHYKGARALKAELAKLGVEH